MDVDELIAEVSRQTGVRLSKADPVLAAAALHEAAFDRALVKLDRQIQAQADRITAASDQAMRDARKEAQALLAEAGERIEVRIRTAGEAAALSVLASLRQETHKAEQARRVTIQVAWATAIAGMVVLSGVAGMVLAGLR